MITAPRVMTNPLNQSKNLCFDICENVSTHAPRKKMMPERRKAWSFS
jgi:hypothetical protein